MKTEHPYAATLRAIADGETDFEVELKHGFEKCPVGNVLTFIKNMSVPPEQIRIKRKTRTINGITVPEPYFGPMEVGRTFYIPITVSTTNYSNSFSWTDSLADKEYLKSGFIHLSRENAEAWSKAWRATCAPQTVADVEAVERPELKVGQTWLTVGGDEVTVASSFPNNTKHPFDVEKKDGSMYSVNAQGKAYGGPSNDDLGKLIADVDQGGGV